MNEGTPKRDLDPELMAYLRPLFRRPRFLRPKVRRPMPADLRARAVARAHAFVAGEGALSTTRAIARGRRAIRVRLALTVAAFAVVVLAGLAAAVHLLGEQPARSAPEPAPVARQTRS